ncbi:hypothetical protein JQ625_00190 [Bradyrhizobium diazoefficiens]|nr:C1 family peptidase [Bradyrhizobium diazoefficiens]MBR0773237.1 hypothetical protein [Bradyrhizobium diazoefficiens]
MERLVILITVAFALLGATLSSAQDGRRAASPSGLVLETPEELARLPRAPAFRDWRPPRVDLSSNFPRAGNQIGGTCTAWAVSYARAYYTRKVENRSLTDPSNIPSPLYLYNKMRNGKGVNGKSCENAGSSPYDAIGNLWDGALSLRDYPNRLPLLCQLITPQQRANANDFHTKRREVLGTSDSPDGLLEAILGSLAKNDPAIIAIQATDMFRELNRSKPVMYSVGTPCDAEACGHAIVAVGYDDERQLLKVMNSWGEDWGQNGFGWMSYAVAKKILMMGVVTGPRPPPPPPTPPSPPPSCSMTITPDVIQRGSSATLSYTSKNSVGGRIDKAIGGVFANGSVRIVPEATTTYIGTFLGNDSNANATCAATVTVTEPPHPPPIIVAFNSNRGHIAKGGSATLSWSASNTSLVRLDGETVPEVGSKTVTPSGTTKYTLNAINKGGVGVSATTVVAVEDSSIISLPEDRCGHIELAYQQGQKVIGGFVGTFDDIEWLRVHYGDARLEVDVTPWPLCEARQTLNAPIAKGVSDGLKVKIRKADGLSLLRDGDPLIFEVETPSYPSYMHVAYIQADGTVANLSARGTGLQSPRPPSTTLTFGTGDLWGQFRVSAPFGREMLVVLASKRPIFDNQRSEKETERQFLDALRAAIFADGGSIIAANIDTIVTAQR